MSNFDLRAVLSGMKREEALACVLPGTEDGNHSVYVFAGHVWTGCPNTQGLKNSCENCNCFACRTAAINAFYDEQETEPKWVEPAGHPVLLGLNGNWFHEQFYSVANMPDDVARTNARRKVEAFIRENGRGGDFEICIDDWELSIVEGNCETLGAITCATRELADEVIRRYPDELRLLSGR